MQCNIMFFASALRTCAMNLRDDDIEAARQYTPYDSWTPASSSIKSTQNNGNRNHSNITIC